jgi:hypothetical protein
MNESLVKYLAGLLDADGSLSLTFRQDPNGSDKFFVGLSMNLTSSDAVDLTGFVSSLPTLTGMGSIQRYGAKKQFIAWVVAKRADLEMLLPRLVKHMVIKAKHWQWLLEQWRENRTGQKGGWTCSAEEREILSNASKESRRTRVGPLKPKNHPTWAWLAGYLDGDGTYAHRHHRNGRTGTYQWSMLVSVLAHANDAVGLELICRSFGGQIKERDGNLRIWTRALGYHNRSFALRFLPHLAKHSRLKRPRIDAMIHHHQQRLSVPGCEKTFCKIDDCGRPSWGHQMCSMHYQRWRKANKSFVVSDSLNASSRV